MSSRPEVDSFGRTLPSRNERKRSPPRRNDGFDRSDRNLSAKRSNFDGPSRRDSHDFDNKGHAGDFPDQRERDWVPRGSGDRYENREYARGSSGRGGRGGFGRGDMGTRRQPPPPSQPISIVKGITLPPMPTFKNFMLAQPDDNSSPELFQRRYEDFQVQYIMDFSMNFFDNTKNEEWFRERYDPLRQKELEQESIKWAAQESAEFKKELLENPKLAIDALRLDPKISKSTSPSVAENSSMNRMERQRDESNDDNEHEEHMDQIDVSNEIVEVETEKDVNPAVNVEIGQDSDKTASALTSASSSSSEKEPPSVSRRLLYLSGIPADCPRTILTNAIKDASNNLAERIIIAPPAWNKSLTRGFERTAWVVLPSKTIAHELMVTLRQLRVNIPGPGPGPGPVDPITGEVPISSSFEIQVHLHAPRHTQTTPECSSVPARIAYDTARALELAELLDEDRNIPPTQRIHTLFNSTTSASTTTPTEVKEGHDIKEEEKVSSTTESNNINNIPVLHTILNENPSDKLDLIISYLRRVHFVVYYGGRRYIDEAQMLSYSPAPVKRMISTVLFDHNEHNTMITSTTTTPSSSNKNTTTATIVKEENKSESIETVSLPSQVVEGKEEGDNTTDSSSSITGKRPREDDNENITTETKTEETTGVTTTTTTDEEGLEREEGEEGEERKVITTGGGRGGNSNSTPYEIALQQDWKRHPFMYSMDKRIDEMMKDLRSKTSRKLAGITSPDEEELKAVEIEQEKILEVWEKDLMKPEMEGKCRCAVEWCNKLFKGPEFLKKHLRTKHIEMASNLLLKASESFMRIRYEAEDLLTRPLPLVPCEISGGGFELRTVKEILERCNRLPRNAMGGSSSSGGSGRGGGGRGRHSNTGRGVGGGSRGRGEYQDRRWSTGDGGIGGGGGYQGRGGGGFHGRGGGRDMGGGGGGGDHGQYNNNDRRHSGFNGGGGRGGGGGDRMMISYVDVDAPEISSTNLDYGVALLPPPKKRRLSSKKD
eukprot:gene1159-2251_t